MSHHPPVVRKLGRGSRRGRRLVAAWAQRLRSREVALRRGGAMAWHSTNQREELLICLSGRATLEWRKDGQAPVPARVRLTAGQTLFLSAGTPHRVVNAGTGVLRYLYVTG